MSGGVIMRAYAIFMLFFGGRYWVRYLIAALLFAAALYALASGRGQEAARLAYLAAPVPEAVPIDQVRRDPKAHLQLAHLRATLATDMTVQLGRGGELVYILQDVDAPDESLQVRAIISIPGGSEDEFAGWIAGRNPTITEAGLVIDLDGEVRPLNDDRDASKHVKRMGWQISPDAFRFFPYLEPRHERLAHMKFDPTEVARWFFYAGLVFAALGALQGLWPRKRPATPAPVKKPRLVLSRRGQWALGIFATLGVLGLVTHDLFSGRSVWLVALGLLTPAVAGLNAARRAANASQKALAPIAQAIAEQEAQAMAYAMPAYKPAPTGGHIGGPIASAPNLMERLSPFLAHTQTAKWMPLILVVGVGLVAPKILGFSRLAPTEPLANMADGVNPLNSLPLTAGAAAAFGVTLTAAWLVQRYLRLNARAKIIAGDPWERIERERLK